MTRRLTALGTLAAALLAGCGDDDVPSAEPAPPSPLSVAPSGAPSRAPDAELERCTEDVLSPAAGEVQPFASTRRLLVSVTNTGDVACTLLGFGGAALVDAQGRPLPTKLVRSEQEPRTVVLDPGGSTVRELSWRVVPTGPADPATDCVTGAGLLLTPPDEEPGDLRLEQEITACDGGTLIATPWGQTAD